MGKTAHVTRTFGSPRPALYDHAGCSHGTAEASIDECLLCFCAQLSRLVIPDATNELCGITLFRFVEDNVVKSVAMGCQGTHTNDACVHQLLSNSPT